MFIAKPHEAGKPVELDGSDKAKGLVDLAATDNPKLLQAQDFGEFGNPDGAGAGLSGKPGVMQGAPAGALRSENMSGKGKLHPTAQNSAPKSNPFPAPTSSVRTSPSSIKV